MSNATLIRAWKDEDYRESLGEVESPVGAMELSETELDQISGNGVSCHIFTIILVICKQFSFICGVTFAAVDGD
jgi:mersacidin/lichenicidin family type 2 lantibiotic